MQEHWFHLHQEDYSGARTFNGTVKPYALEPRDPHLLLSYLYSVTAHSVAHLAAYKAGIEPPSGETTEEESQEEPQEPQEEPQEDTTTQGPQHTSRKRPISPRSPARRKSPWDAAHGSTSRDNA
jgi:hypothetical protein